MTDEILSQAEERLGYRLPDAYAAVLRHQNGGSLRRYRYRRQSVKQEQDEKDDSGVEFWVHHLYGIGGDNGIDAANNGDGRSYNEWLIDQWGFPKEAVVICFGGHGGILLDYRLCGPHGEPCVIAANSEGYPNVEVEFLAPSFAMFLAGLTEF